MCGEPFVIAPYDNKPNSTTRQSLQPEVATEMHSSMLGKRKVQDDIQSLEEKGNPYSKNCSCYIRTGKHVS